jgi:hypothetical protein
LALDEKIKVLRNNILDDGDNESLSSSESENHQELKIFQSHADTLKDRTLQMIKFRRMKDFSVAANQSIMIEKK